MDIILNLSTKFEKYTLILISIAFIIFNIIYIIEHKTNVSVLSILLSSAILFFVYNYLYRNNIKNIIDALEPVIFFNIFIIIANYYPIFAFDPLYLKVGLTWGNFSDFFANSASVIGEEKGQLLRTTGYFPLSEVIAYIIAYILGWNKSINVMWWAKTFYVIIFVGLYIIPTYKLFKTLFLENSAKQGRILSIVGLLVIYPTIFVFERGNYVLFTYFFLLLAIKFYVDKQFEISIFLFALLASLKLFNLIFFIFVILNFKCRLIIRCFIYFVLIFFISLILRNYLIGGNTEFDILRDLKSILGSGFSFTDPQKVFISSIESIRVAFYTVIFNSLDAISSITRGVSLAYAVLAAASFILFFWQRREIKDWRIDLLYLILLPVVFHHSSADYSLILLLLPATYLAVNFNEHKQVLRYYFCTLLLLKVVPLLKLTLVPNGFLAISLGNIIYPLCFIFILLRVLRVYK